MVVTGYSDVDNLKNLKNILLTLQGSWLQEGNRFVMSGDQREDFSKRLLLLEGELDGLLKRRVNFSTGDSSGRVLDYDLLMNEKENQLVELEKKIQNLEEKMRRGSQREKELENEIVRLTNVVKASHNANLSKSEVDRLCINIVDYEKLNEKFNNLKNQIQSFSSLYKTQCDKFKAQGIRLENEASLDSLLRSDGIVASVCNGVVNVVEYRDKVVEVPIQDSRTKHLIHLLATQMKKNFDKYPKLREECDSRLYEFFQQELIDCMEIDELERIVEIVKYVPEVVKVENVYAYSSEKSRKVEFHLRVLVKALLEELEKLKMRTGATLEIDEGIIGMINQEIMGVVNVDDILKVFRVVPKIVEVEKVVEKIVEKIVEVPQIVAVEKIVEKIVEVERIKEIEKQVPVPIEVPCIVATTQDRIVNCERTIEKPVEIPTVVDRIVEVIREVPRVETVDRMVEKIVEVDKVVTVKEVVNHIQTEIKEVEIVKEKVVTVEKVIEKIVEVPVYVEKIVEKIVKIPELVEVEKIVEKIVKEVEIVTAK